MNVEELVQGTLRDLADEQPPARPGLADRVLVARRRRRTRRVAAVAVATAAVVAVTVAVPQLVEGSGRDDDRRAAQVGSQRDPSAPRKGIAVGQTVLATYYTQKLVAKGKDEGVVERTYWLLDPRTNTYREDGRWSYVAVAPGAGTAAVLERDLPANRIGLLDLATGEVERWIPVERGIGGLAYSSDGSQLVATTYDEHPDLGERVQAEGEKDSPLTLVQRNGTTRTGFFLVDVAGGTVVGPWRKVEAGRDVWGRADFAFTRDDARLYARVVGGQDGMEKFYDLSDGDQVEPPADEKHLRWDVPARLSPNGELAALGLTKEVDGKNSEPAKSYSSIRDPRTGEEITKVRGGHLLAWVDDQRLLAWERTTGLHDGDGYKDRLVLVTLGSDRIVPLSGERDPDDGFERTWEPVFVTR
ncbi:hypothetical protein Stsp02_37170 [Streptomyces sp. NBRC 14336]|uniref:WD40 repeat domain-containing protein n=1 Tax=Streptomyces sp. NBRC 14336 TaxID=3030992 RepID=UPI0024A3AEC8|nr:WD40 repeat domain-containing protein [Streptomyces sp. NBRC 14336]WBO77249.1 WD40 repeat domain-containing protein [Streptomyces sp. SBE_14.2]GLW48055.1 hypothetical protein Stsp02_37170 [Streptomyces sp. NBRC 14336]